MNGCDVDVVVDGHVLRAFVDCLLCCLINYFWAICVINLSVSTNYLARDSSVVICFFGERLFTRINFVDGRLLLAARNSELFDVSSRWSFLTHVVEIRDFDFIESIHYGFNSLIRTLLFWILSIIEVNSYLVIHIRFWAHSQLRVLFALFVLLLEFQKSLLHYFLT